MINIFINLVTISRIIFAVIIFVILAMKGNYLFALFLFFIAGMSDFFDGYLARKYDATSQIGEILDPIADKILIVFLIFGLALNLNSTLIAFIGAFIISREIFVSALRDYSARNNNVSATKVSYLAKIKTSIQLLTIFIYLLGLAADIMFLIVIADIFLIISLLITMYTGYEYTMKTFFN